MELAGLGNQARVGGEHAFDVRADLARLGPEGGRERDRGDVRAAPPERRDVEVGRDALEAGDEHDLVLVERFVDPLCADVDDLRLAVRRVGDDARLRAGQRDRLVPEVVDRHCRERTRDALTDRDQHVELARLRARRHLVGERDEIVRRVAHRREHGNDARAALPGGHYPLRHGLQPLRVRDRGAAELHHHGADGGVVGLARDGRDGLVIRGRDLGHPSSVIACLCGP